MTTRRLRRPGTAPPSDVHRSGDPVTSAVLAEALACAPLEDPDPPEAALTHGFHTYPAGLAPEAARRLLPLLPSNGRLLDPFAGGGTVLVEAMVAGRPAVGVDVSPVARLVSRGRTWTADEATLTTFRSASRRMTESAVEATEAGPLPEDPEILRVARWYEPHVARELECLRRALDHSPPDVRLPLRFCFSSILVKASRRQSDTARREVEGTRPPGTTAVLFHKKCREFARRVSALTAVVPPGTPPAEVIQGDARRLDLGGISAVLTSPPYPGVYDYVPMQELRLAWLGLSPEKALRDELGSRRSFRADRSRAREAWLADTRTWLGRVFHTCLPGARMVVVVGDGLVGERVLPAGEPIDTVARELGWRAVARASGDRVDHARGTVRREHFLLYERPERP